MDIRKLQRVIVDGLEDVKAQNIVVFNTEHLSPLFERVIVASGTSNRQTKSLAASVRDAVKAAGDPPPRTEGERQAAFAQLRALPATLIFYEAPGRTGTTRDGAMRRPARAARCHMRAPSSTPTRMA